MPKPSKALLYKYPCPFEDKCGKKNGFKPQFALDQHLRGRHLNESLGTPVSDSKSTSNKTNLPGNCSYEQVE
jgi:hypothetical protein